MSDYLSADELEDLTGYKAGQYALMRNWLDRNGWKYAVSKNHMPKVLKAFRDQKLGMSEVKKGNDNASNAKTTPNYAAFGPA